MKELAKTPNRMLMLNYRRYFIPKVDLLCYRSVTEVKMKFVRKKTYVFKYNSACTGNGTFKRVSDLFKLYGITLTHSAAGSAV